MGGFVHDINTVASLSDEPNNIRLLSDKSLHILQNLSQEDITFLSRYGEILGGDFYLPVLAGSPEEADVEDAIDLIRRDLNDMSVEELLECLCTQISVLAQEAMLAGQEIESQLSDGVVETGPGHQFESQSEYFQAKCSVANGIYDTVHDLVDWLEDHSVDLLAGVLGGVTSGLLVALTISGPVGWTIAISGVALAALAAFLIGISIEFEDLLQALEDVHDECVLALFNASDAVTAEANFIAAVAASSEPTTSIERQLVGYLLSADMLNQLFSPRGDVAVYSSPDPVDCDSAILIVWDFEADVESWTFRDDSTANASASGSYNATLESIQADQQVISGGPGRVTNAVNVSPAISQALVTGDSVQWDYSAPSDGVVVFRIMTITYTDASTEEAIRSGHTSAGTLVLTVVESKTLEKIELLTGRSNGTGTAGWTFTTQTLEVRVVGQ